MVEIVDAHDKHKTLAWNRYGQLLLYRDCSNSENHYRYDEWHDQRVRREQNLRFQGQYLDRETGLHYNTFRFFDADVGRFTQPDPIGLLGGAESLPVRAELNWVG